MTAITVYYSKIILFCEGCVYLTLSVSGVALCSFWPGVPAAGHFHPDVSQAPHLEIHQFCSPENSEEQ